MSKVVSTILSPITSILGLGEKPPEPKKQPVMPTMDTELVEMARRREAQGARARSGRMSTILTQDSGLFSSDKV